MSSPLLKPDMLAYSQLLAQSFVHWMKRPLIEASDISHALYHASFALVSHDTQSDPVFCYANLAAQKLWGVSWEEFIRLPSRLSAEPVAAAERQQLLDEAMQKGYVEEYQGIRITKDGRRFMIKDTVLWNVVDSNGILHGQAATISKWEWL